MSAHLLAATIGPVQDFIAAARRTRDLWFGSFVLSEISKAAAAELERCGATLIFPAPGTDLSVDSSVNVVNVIIAELPTGKDPKTVAERTKSAAQTRWRNLANDVLTQYEAFIEQSIWNDQIDDVVEFYSAWTPLTSDYRASRAAVMRLLGARKSLRDFHPARGREGVWKSSLDGARESVLRKKHDASPRLRLNTGEQLDVVGLVKRVAGGTQHYPSVSRVAADPWLRGIPTHELATLADICPLFLTQIDTSADKGVPKYAHFPVEGSVVYRSRYSELREEAGTDLKTLEQMGTAVGNLVRKYGEPSPYLCVLVADGDKMGETISNIDSAEHHREFSKQLSAFAAEARSIVQENNGVLVYAGGDDVLAFLPVDLSLKCARELADAFSNIRAGLTLSVGLAIGHFMEPLEDLLESGRQAEKHAKKPRPGEAGHEKDALAVHLSKRGGSPVETRGNWGQQPEVRLAKMADWLRTDGISQGIAYQLRQIADVYATWPADTVARAMRKDVLSILQGKAPGIGSRLDPIKAMIEQLTDAASLKALSTEILVARAFAGAAR